MSNAATAHAAVLWTLRYSTRLRQAFIVISAVYDAVSKGPTGAQGPAGAKGAQGPQGPTGDGAAAYAFVVPPEVSMGTDPVFVAARTRGFATVTNPLLGLYCLAPTGSLDPSTRSWVATVEYSRADPAQVTTAEPDTGAGCPSGTFGVRTLKLAMTPTPHWSAAWDVAFMVVVP